MPPRGATGGEEQAAAIARWAVYKAFRGDLEQTWRMLNSGCLAVYTEGAPW